MRFFFGEHGRDLPFGCAMNARIRPTFFPTIQIGLRLFQTFEAHPFERSSLGVTDAGFHFSFAIRILDPARQRHQAIMCEHISKQC